MTFGQIVLANPVCMVLVVSQSNCFCELGLYGAGCLLVKLLLRTRFALCRLSVGQIVFTNSVRRID